MHRPPHPSPHPAPPFVPPLVQVSWLMLWLLLLGTEDFAAEEQLLNGHQHRRPAEADMVDAAAQLAAVAADVEVGGWQGGDVFGLCVGGEAGSSTGRDACKRVAHQHVQA